MKERGRHEQTGINALCLRAALEEVLYDKRECTAFVSEHDKISYGNVAVQIEKQYNAYRSHCINRIALCMSNSIEFCIKLLTAILYLDEIYIFSPLYMESEMLQICKDNKVQVLDFGEGKTILGHYPHIAEEKKDIRIILFTSGTMHASKGVILTGKNIYSNALATIDCMKYKDTDKLLITKPLYHSYGLTVELIAGLLVGAELYLDRGLFSVHKILRIMFEHQITVWCTIPALLFLFVDKSVSVPGSLRIIAVGGARSTEILLKKARNLLEPIPIVQLYGLTEAGPLVTCTPIDMPTEKTISIGKPVKGVKLELRDENDDLVTVPGRPGELVVTGNGIMIGYLGDAKATRRVKRKGKLYTGDIGYFDIDNYYYIQDRIDATIARDGINISCSEIEDALMKLDGVEQASVIGIENILHSQIAIAFIRTSKKLDVRKVVLWCKAHGVFPPDDVMFIDDIPCNENGKVNGKKLRTIYLAHKKD